MSAPFTYRHDAESGTHCWVDPSVPDAAEIQAELCQTFYRTVLVNQANAGRGALQFISTSSGFNAAIRGYRRGGLIRHLSQDRYLGVLTNLERLRPVRELLVLSALFVSGIRVPRPIGAAVRFGPGPFLYRASLATQRVDDAHDLEDVAQTRSVEVLERSCVAAGAEAKRMLMMGVFHPDLHPGNVLLDRNGGIMLLDFDRAVQNPKPLEHRADRLASRWKRAVEKRALPVSMVKWFKQGLYECGE